MAILTAEEMLTEHKTIQEGFLKGARITLTGADIIKLMEDYHAQFVKFQYCPECGLDLSKVTNTINKDK